MAELHIAPACLTLRAVLAPYQRAGFVRIACFDDYVDSPLSLCTAERLSEAALSP